MKTVQNQSFWREILDEVSSLLFVFRIAADSQARLVYVNERIRDVLGYAPADFVMASEDSGGPVPTMVETLLDALAAQSHLDAERHSGFADLTHAHGGSVRRAYRFRMFQPSSGRDALMVVTFSEAADAASKPEGGLVAESDRMKDLLARLAAYARERRSLWIHGEPGTGRRSLARHYAGLLPEPVRIMDPAGIRPKEAVRDPVVIVSDQPVDGWIDGRREREEWVFRKDIQPVHVAPWRYRPEDASALVADTLERLSAMVPIDEGTRRRLMSTRVPEGEAGGVRAWVLREVVGSTARPEPDMDGGRTWEEMSAVYLKSVMDRCGGKIYGSDGAAAMLGLKPTTLQSKLKRLGVR
jgi:transcriptional regulator with GAF, ATPase, and Fis domain